MPSVFISHATKEDGQFARRLANDLKRSSVEVWIAPESIRPGEDWVDAINRGLKESSHVVVVLTPAAVKSKWVRIETNAAIALERKGRIQIIPLDVKPCEVPPLSSTYQMVSFRRDYEAGLSQLATILGVRVPPPEPVRPRTVKEKPTAWGGLPIWVWGIALVAALVIGGTILSAIPTPVPVAGRATTPAAAVAPTATHVPLIDTPMPKPPPPTPTPMPTRTPTPAETEAPTASPVTEMMVEIPAGEFIMGSDKGDSNEQPVHTVYLDAFYIDKYEVTNAQFAQFLNEQRNQEEGGVTWLDIRHEDCLISQSGEQYRPKSGYEDHPVIEVSWYGAKAYCQWAGKRLPTEAEWEKAARGTDGRTYPWGEGIDCDHAQYGGDECTGQTVPVGSKPKGASPYGALDMVGNVWEWVADWYDSGYYNQSPGRNPLGPDSGEYRVLRGGGWGHAPYHVRSAYRFRSPPVGSRGDFGFRCARGSQ
jgi:formylglycine-generating enzyme required for sulfatase activity